MRANVPVAFVLAALCWTITVQPADVRVIDGDTFDVAAAIWPGYWGRVVSESRFTVLDRVRVLGVDTPERGEPEFVEAGAFTERWILVGPFQLTVCRRDSLNRLLGEVVRGDERLADALAAARLVKGPTP